MKKIYLFQGIIWLCVAVFLLSTGSASAFAAEETASHSGSAGIGLRDQLNVGQQPTDPPPESRPPDKTPDERPPQPSRPGTGGQIPDTDAVTTPPEEETEPAPGNRDILAPFEDYAPINQEVERLITILRTEARPPLSSLRLGGGSGLGNLPKTGDDRLLRGIALAGSLAMACHYFLLFRKESISSNHREADRVAF